MKDLYSFDVDEAGLDVSYHKMYDAYTKIFARCGLNALPVEADTGMMGGVDSHEFMVISENGEDQIVLCRHCGYQANLDRAQGKHPPRETPSAEIGPIEEVSTPGIKTIEQLTDFFKIGPEKFLKTVLYSVEGQKVAVLIRGDREVNEVKLLHFLGLGELKFANDEQFEAARAVPGYTGPLGLHGTRIVADLSVTDGMDFIAGANKDNFHIKNLVPGRDFVIKERTDLGAVQEGDECLQCGHPLSLERGIEVGHVFKLGTKYAQALGATYLDANGEEKVIIMGSYGIGIGRLVAAIIEEHHDDKGIIWPASVAPYQVQLVGLNSDTAEIKAAAEELYERLTRAGIEVLYDDREESAGVKFNDADLIGLPWRLTISARTLKNNAVEFKSRAEAEAFLIPLSEAVEEVKRRLES